MNKLKSLHSLLLVFITFTCMTCLFTTVCIYFTEKTDILGLQNLPVETKFTEKDGQMELSWTPLPYPCIYKVESFYKTTGMIENEPEYVPINSEYTTGSTYVVSTTAIPTYYKISAYGIFGKVAASHTYVENPIYAYPFKPVSVFHYTASNPASVKPFIVWHSVPDAVLYEFEILSGPPDKENNVTLSTQNHIYSTQQVFTNGMQFDLTPYLDKAPVINGYRHLYWRARAMNLKKQPVGVFSDTEEIVISENVSIPNKPLLNKFDRMPNFQMPVYPVYHWIPMLGAAKYEVELMTHPPKKENNTEPTSDGAWRKAVDSSFACYDEYARPYAGDYYWRVRALDEKGETLGVYSDTDHFTVDASIQRCLVATFGDSITHGGGAVSFSPASLQYSYQSYITVPVVNLGRSGDTSATTLERFERDVLPIHPLNLIIMTGSNSLRDSGFTAESIISDLEKIRDKCEANGIRPIFLTLPPINPENILRAFRTPTDPDWHQKMSDVNAFVRKQQYYIDIENYFYDSTHTMMDPRWANDGLHPDIEGKMLIGEAISMKQSLLKK